jgi:hypothetical protein
MLKLLEKEYPYTLKDICAYVGIDSIHTARKYLSNVLPPACVEKDGNKKPAKFSEYTLCAFMVLKQLVDKKLLTWAQIKAVLSSLDQEQIIRIARGYEPLHLHLAVPEEVDALANGANAEYGNEKVLLIEGETVKAMDFQGAATEQLSVDVNKEGWASIPITENLELRYKGKFSDKQVEELSVAARILKSIAED